MSEGEHELLFKLKYEGFEAKELAEATGVTSSEHRRLHRRLQTIINRLLREAGNLGWPKPSEGRLRPTEVYHPTEKILTQGGEFLRGGAL